ncbi:MAG TPA: hypothetical protein VKB86_01135 [Pyrinomonadaceae bacterium]|nr:hypothetical protein [Pyrinomonadaceae bacterium]
MRRTRRILLLILLIVCPSLAHTQTADNVVTGSINELRNKRRVFLIVSHNSVVDAKEEAKSILAEVYQSGSEPPRGQFARIYNAIADKLNKYMAESQSISSVRNIGDADFIILFNLLEYRWPLGRPYPYGEMFVILNDHSHGREPHVVWRTRKRSEWAEDAIKEFIRDLKATRGEIQDY